MMDESAKRVKLATEIKVASANLETARQREREALKAIERIEATTSAVRQRYAACRSDVLVAREQLAAEHLPALMERLNAALEQLAESEPSMQRARTELGTARAECRKLLEQHDQLWDRLIALLPPVLTPAVESAVSVEVAS